MNIYLNLIKQEINIVKDTGLNFDINIDKEK